MAKTRGDHIIDQAEVGGKYGAGLGGLMGLLEGGAGAAAMASEVPHDMPTSKSALAKWILKQTLMKGAKYGAVGAGLGGTAGAFMPVKGEK